MCEHEQGANEAVREERGKGECVGRGKEEREREGGRGGEVGR